MTGEAQQYQANEKLTLRVSGWNLGLGYQALVERGAIGSRLDDCIRIGRHGWVLLAGRALVEKGVLCFTHVVRAAEDEAKNTGAPWGPGKEGKRERENGLARCK